MSTGASLLRGSIFRTLDLCVAVGAAFVVTPFLVHAVGDRVYGFWTLVAAFIGYYGLLDMGLTSAAARYLSQALGRGDAAELDRTCGTALLLFCSIAGAVMALTAATALACPLFFSRPDEAALFRRLLLLMGAAAAVSFPAKVYGGMLQAGIRHDALAGISIARALLCNGGLYLCLRLGHGITAVAAVTLAANSLQCAATYAAFRRLFPGVSASPAGWDFARARQMLGYGAKTLVAQLGDVLRFRLDTVLIAAFLGASLVTPYAVGARVVEAFVQLVFGSVGMMLPVFSQYEGRGDYDAIRAALLKATKLTTVASTFIGLSIIFYGRAFIRRWMGPGFDGAYGVAAVLCAGYLLELPQTPGIQVLYGLSRHRVYAVLSVYEGAANLLLSVWLLRSFGIYGVALGTTIAFAVFKLAVQPVYICRAVSLPVSAYLGAMGWALLKSAAPLGVYFLAVRTLVTPSYGRLTACVAAQTLLFAPAAYYLILGREERRAVRASARALLPGRKRGALPVSVEG
jgi:O-antigen/teichoic acid export membrane protein